jgi:hypothetical protein
VVGRTDYGVGVGVCPAGPLLSFQLGSFTHWTLGVEAAPTGPAPRLNPPDGGASPLGGQFLFCILMGAAGISLGGGGVDDTRGD